MAVLITRWTNRDVGNGESKKKVGTESNTTK